MENIFTFFKSTIIIMIPIFYAAVGGLFPALAGSLNIALEGLILISAFSSFAVYYFSGSIIAAIISACLAAVLLAVLHSFAAFKLKANLFITGIAINLLSSGLCAVLSDKLFNTKGVVALTEKTSNLMEWYIILGLFLLLVTWITIYKTPFGYRLRSCDKNSQSLISLGINPKKYQSAAIIISAFFCGIGGSFLSLNINAYVPEMSAGRGWIALALIFLGFRKPVIVFIAALIFALAEGYSNYAQGFFDIPSGFVLAFPYICSLFAIIVVSIVPKKSSL
ncbi:MAG: ABC transporter permease [Treponema sp.]|nr:ABC transporter permease [Treponema sp.]